MGGRGGGSSRASNQGPAAPAAAATAATADTPMESRLLAAYRVLQQRFNNDWVVLSELREALGGDRADQDRALMSLVRERRIRLIPEENRRTLQPRDHAAAINVAGEMKHLIGIPS